MLQKTEHNKLLNEAFTLRSGTQVRIRWLPHCKKLKARCEKELENRRINAALKFYNVYVVEFRFANNKAYALVYQELIRDTVEKLKAGDVHDALFGASVISHRNKLYWWSEPFFNTLEEAINANVNPYLVPLLQNDKMGVCPKCGKSRTRIAAPDAGE